MPFWHILQKEDMYNAKYNSVDQKMPLAHLRIVATNEEHRAELDPRELRERARVGSGIVEHKHSHMA